MMMITKGQKVTDISEQLNLSPKTVNSYRYRLFSKLGINGDVELTIWPFVTACWMPIPCNGACGHQRRHRPPFAFLQVVGSMLSPSFAFIR